MRNLLVIAALLLSAGAHALTADEAKAIAIGEGDSRIEALRAAVAKVTSNRVINAPPWVTLKEFMCSGSGAKRSSD